MKRGQPRIGVRVGKCRLGAKPSHVYASFQVLTLGKGSGEGRGQAPAESGPQKRGKVGYELVD